MAKGIAHDMNNLLTTILGHAEIARMKTPEDSRSRSQEQVVSGTCEAAESSIEC